MGIFINDSSGKPIVGKVKNLGYFVIITYSVILLYMASLDLVY